MEHCHLPLHTLQPAAQLSPETWEPEDCLPLPTHIPGCTVLTFGVEGAEMLWKTGTQEHRCLQEAPLRWCGPTSPGREDSHQKQGHKAPDTQPEPMGVTARGKRQILAQKGIPKAPYCRELPSVLLPMPLSPATLPATSHTVTSYTVTNPCSSFGMLAPALGQRVQATTAPEAQFQLLRALGGKKKVLLHLSKECFWMPEGALAVCHSGKVALSPGAQGSVALPHEWGAWPLLPAPQPLSEYKQVTIHHQPLLC